MAVGARSSDILLQFLIEAVTLSLLGGAAGLVLGVLSTARLASWFGWPVLLRPNGIALSVGVSMMVGIAFGLYPAWRAATLEPIDALRFES